MNDRIMDRKEFFSRIGRTGVCMCAAAAGMASALKGAIPDGNNAAKEAAQKPVKDTVPGEKSVERAAKRMEFADGWVKRFLEVMERLLDAGTREKLMQANGKDCYIAYAGEGRRRATPLSFEQFAGWIAQKGKDHGYSVVGNDIFSEYTGSAETGKPAPESVCLCPMVEAQAAGKIPAFYCLCSVGYVREMHEQLLGRPVEVQLVDSVLRGGKRCKFKINLV
jgi:hypothetical protein